MEALMAGAAVAEIFLASLWLGHDAGGAGTSRGFLDDASTRPSNEISQACLESNWDESEVRARRWCRFEFRAPNARASGEVRNASLQIYVGRRSACHVRHHGRNRRLRRVAFDTIAAATRPSNSTHQFGRICGTPSMNAPGPRGVHARLRLSEEGVAALYAKRQRAQTGSK